MQVLHKLPPSKTWKLAQNTVTGHIFTSNIYISQSSIDAAKAAFAADGTVAPDGSVQRTGGVYDNKLGWVYPPYTGPGLHDVVLLDHIPVVRLQAKFKHLYRGTSDVAIQFTTPAEYTMLLRGSSSDKFFRLVGEGKIIMNGDGYYEFDVNFSKGGDKIYMELYGY